MHSQNIPRHSLETFLDALWEFCKYLLNACSKTLRQLSGHSGNFPETHLDTGNTLWKPSVNSLDAQETFQKLSRHCKHPLETLSQLLDTLELLKILAGCSFRNSQATLQTLMKPSENSLRHWKHHLKAFSELSGHTLEIHQIFPRCSFRNSQATFLTLRKHSRNSLRHWKHSLETLRQLSGHSGNVPETQEMFRKLTWTLETPIENPQSTPGHCETS